MQVRFKKAGPKHADRILHVAFDAMLPMRPMHSGFLRTVVRILRLGRKRREAILLQSIRTCALHFSIAFVSILPPPIRLQL